MEPIEVSRPRYPLRWIVLVGVIVIGALAYVSTSDGTPSEDKDLFKLIAVATGAACLLLLLIAHAFNSRQRRIERLARTQWPSAPGVCVGTSKTRKSDGNSGRSRQHYKVDYMVHQPDGSAHEVRAVERWERHHQPIAGETVIVAWDPADPGSGHPVSRGGQSGPVNPNIDPRGATSLRDALSR